MRQAQAIGMITINFASGDHAVGEMIRGFPGAPSQRKVDSWTAGEKLRILEAQVKTLSGPARKALVTFTTEFKAVNKERNNLIHGFWSLPLEGESPDAPAWLWRHGKREERPPELLEDFVNRTAALLPLIIEAFTSLDATSTWKGITLTGPHRFT